MDLYLAAGNVIDKVTTKQASLSTATYQEKYKNKKKLCALVSETIKYRGILETIITNHALLQKEKNLEKRLVYPILYDLLIGTGLPKIGNKNVEAVYRHKTALHSQLVRLKVKAKVMSASDLLPAAIKNRVKLPRYVRVNTLRSSVDEVITTLTQDGFTKLESVPENHFDVLKHLQPREFVVDTDVPALLALHHGSDLHNHTLFRAGKIILQDKASCLPAFVLRPERGSHVIDACAAPGNKTTQLAAFMENTGKIFAVDRDEKRLSVLRKRVCEAGATCVEPIHGDFLQLNTHDKRYAHVDCILVDPSCSGSGIASRLDDSINDGEDEAVDSAQRLQSLSQFQLHILSHALSFPTVQRVVYSTCSIHEQENEFVVAAAEKKFAQDFTLEKILPSWPVRGNEDVFPGAVKCIRASVESTLCNGFFVALFKRKGLDHTSDRIAALDNAVLTHTKNSRKHNQSFSGNSLLNASVISTDQVPVAQSEKGSGITFETNDALIFRKNGVTQRETTSELKVVNKPGYKLKKRKLDKIRSNTKPDMDCDLTNALHRKTSTEKVPPKKKRKKKKKSHFF